ALLAGRGHPGHHRQVRIDDPRAVAHGAGALRVGAEQRGLYVVRLREGLADRVEKLRVGRRVAAPRTADRVLVDHHDPFTPGDRALDQRALARAGDAGDRDQHAERDVDVHVLEVVLVRAPDLERALRLAHLVLERAAIVEVAAGERVARAQA